MPTALDNGQRSPRKLLRKVVAGLLGGKPRTSGIENRDMNQGVAVVAKLLPGSRERAAEILAKARLTASHWQALKAQRLSCGGARGLRCSKARVSKDLSATSSTTPPARPRAASGHRFSRGLPCWRGRSSTGTAASDSDRPQAPEERRPAFSAVAPRRPGEPFRPQQIRQRIRSQLLTASSR